MHILTDFLKAVVRVAWPKANEGRGLKPNFLVIMVGKILFKCVKLFGSLNHLICLLEHRFISLVKVGFVDD